jgi:Ca-activated chloride channel homolog
MKLKNIFLPSLLGLSLLILAGCVSSSSNSNQQSQLNPDSLTLLSGSENRPLEPLIVEFARQHNIDLQIRYAGSVEIMRELQKGKGSEYDSVWPASSLWLTLGDTTKVLKHQKSIYRSPVVFAVKKSVAQQLGWIGKSVSTEEILKAAESGKLRFMMTSATQSNSGAMAYLASLYAFAGKPEILSQTDLAKPQVQAKLKSLLNKVNRTAASSDYLKDLFLQKYDSYDAMYNYEALVVTANDVLKSQNREPLYVVYPSDGLAIADSPLAYVDKTNPKEEQEFLQIQNFLLEASTQQRLAAMGRRTGAGGQVQTSSVFDPNLGFDTKGLLVPFPLPESTVISQALSLYQTTLRKPSLTVYVLDFSGSMSGNGEADLKAAMNLLLDQRKASEYLLQATPGDISIVIPFNGNIIDVKSVRGNNPQGLADMNSWIDGLSADGGTNIYDPVVRALAEIQKEKYEGYATSVILMTDGQSDGSIDYLKDSYEKSGLPVPVYSITFGDASNDQLEGISKLTNGRVFSGRNDLVHAFREAKGYN